MIYTVSMKAHRRHEARETGTTPDYTGMFSACSGVNSISITDNGRCAKIDVDDGALDIIEEQYSSDFNFTINIKLHP